MKSGLINRYTALGTTEDLIYVPKLNTDLFREGNGIPVLKREVHSFIDSKGAYKEFGCDSSYEHECQLCKYPDKFKRSLRAYLAVAVLRNGAVRTFELGLMAMSYEAYMEHFRHLLLEYKEGVYLKLTYPDVNNLADKILNREIYPVDRDTIIDKDKFECEVLKEFKSLDMLDIQEIRQEFRKTSYDMATMIVNM